MKRVLLKTLIGVLCISLLPMFGLLGCKAEPEVLVQTVTETVVETVEVEKEAVEEEVPPGEKFKGVKLVQCGFAGTAYEPAFRKYAEEFKELTGAEIEFQLFPYEEVQTKLIVAQQTADKTYDLFAFDHEYAYTFYTQFHPLNDLVAEYGLDMSDYLDPLQEYNLMVSPNKGIRYGIPFTGDTAPIFYRKDIIGLEPDEMPTDWEGWWDLLETVQKPDEGLYGTVFAGVPGQLVKVFLSRYRSLGQPLLTPEWEPLVNGETGVKALQMIKYEFDNFTVPGNLGLTNPDAAIAFANGDTVSYQNWPTWIMPKILDPAFPEVNTENIGVIKYFNGGSGNLTNHAFMIFEKSPNKEAAFEWIMYCTSQEKSKDLFMNYGVDVPRKSIYSDPEVMEKLPFMVDFLDAVLNARPIFVGVPYWFEMFNEIGMQTSRYLTGEVSEQVAVDTMAEKWESIIKGNPMPFPYED